MAKFQLELPNDLVQEFEGLERDCHRIFGEMVEAGARVVHNNVLTNMKKSFEHTDKLERGLKVTKIYKTPSDDGINVFVGFYGYVPNSPKTARHPYGTPIPLIAMAREYGTSSGEGKKPFLKQSFKKKEIEQAMKQVQEKYIEGD